MTGGWDVRRFDIAALSDTELMNELYASLATGNAARAAPAVTEIMRRMARNPRCPSCAREREYHRGLCGDCATDGVLVAP